jgi:putative DNA primase/helicase
MSAPIEDDGSRIVELIESAAEIGRDPEPDDIAMGFSPDDEGHENEAGPSDPPTIGVDRDTVAACSALDHSDTDNGKRLRAHFGGDLVVMAQEDAKAPAFVSWTGTHWDMVGGPMAARVVAQKLGGLIALEADHLAQTPIEADAIARGEAAKIERDALDELMAGKKDSVTAEQERQRRDLTGLIAAGGVAKADLQKRKTARRKFAVSSKNRARIEAMLDCAAPHMLKQADAFNADPFLVATQSHTLRFVRDLDPENPDPESTRYTTRVEARPGHRREDLISKLVPVDYAPGAKCPKWTAFLDEFLPVPEIRRFVQVFSGVGLLGITVQRVVMHIGKGANGKSVFMETLMRVLGPLAVGLPAESIVGDTQRGAGQASPDLAKLYGARTLRVLELPADRPLDEALVKKLTGGERIPVRNLFKGYFEFQPVFTGHLSANGFPTISGVDNGIWRRITVVDWPKTIPIERQRDFEDVLADFAPEASGILNWLIEGALAFLRDGLQIPSGVQQATQEYRDDQDPTIAFERACVRAEPGGQVQARSFYEAYVSWSAANAKIPVKETKFGRVMKSRYTRDDAGTVRLYRDIALHDVPARPDVPRNPDDSAEKLW